MRINTFEMLSDKKKQIIANKIKEKKIIFGQPESQDELVFVSSMQGTLKSKLEDAQSYDGYYSRLSLFQARYRGSYGFTFLKGDTLTSFSDILFKIDQYDGEIKNDFFVSDDYDGEYGSKDEELTVFFIKSNIIQGDNGNDKDRKKLGVKNFASGMKTKISLLPLFYLWNKDKFFKISSGYTNIYTEKVSIYLLKLINKNVVNVDYNDLNKHKANRAFSSNYYDRYIIKIKFNDVFTKNDIEFDEEKQRYSLKILDNLVPDIQNDYRFQVWAEKIAGLNKNNYHQIIVNNDDNQSKLKRIIDSDFEKKVLFLNKNNFIFEKKNNDKKEIWPLRNKIEFKIKTNYKRDDYFIYNLIMKPCYTDNYKAVKLLFKKYKNEMIYCIEILKGIYCLATETISSAFGLYNIEEMNCRDKMYCLSSPVNNLYKYQGDIPSNAVLLSKECYSLNDIGKDELTFNINLKNKWTNVGYKAEEICLIVSDFFVFLAIIPDKIYLNNDFKVAVKENIEEVKQLIENNDIDDLLDTVK